MGGSKKAEPEELHLALVDPLSETLIVPIIQIFNALLDEERLLAE